MAATRASFPAADCTLVWADRRGDRAVGVVDVVHDGDDDGYRHQVCCLRDGGLWFAWTEGSAACWLAVDQDSGLVTSADLLEDGTTAVELEDAGGRRVVEVTGDHLFQVLWDVPRDGDRPWPVPVRMRVGDRWCDPALPGVPVRTAYLVEVLLRYEEGDAEEDFWAWEAVDDAVRSDPEQAWTVVRHAIRSARSYRALYWLAAGPLEDLVGDHLAVVIDALVAEAGRDRRFRLALGGVWATVENEVFARRLAAVTEPESADPERRPLPPPPPG